MATVLSQSFCLQYNILTELVYIIMHEWQFVLLLWFWHIINYCAGYVQYTDGAHFLYCVTDAFQKTRLSMIDNIVLYIASTVEYPVPTNERTQIQEGTCIYISLQKNAVVLTTKISGYLNSRYLGLYVGRKLRLITLHT